MRIYINAILWIQSLLGRSPKVEQLRPHTSLPSSLDLTQTSISNLSAFLKNGTFTSVDLVEAYLGGFDVIWRDD